MEEWQVTGIKHGRLWQILEGSEGKESSLEGKRVFFWQVVTDRRRLQGIFAEDYERYQVICTVCNQSGNKGRPDERVNEATERSGESE